MTHTERLLIYRQHPALLEEALERALVPVNSHDDAILHNEALGRFMHPFRGNSDGRQRLYRRLAQAVIEVSEHVISTHH